MGKRGMILFAPLAGISMAVLGQFSQQPPTAGPAAGEHHGRGVNAGGSMSSLSLRAPAAGPSPSAAAPAVAASPAVEGGASGPAPSPEVADPTQLTVSKVRDGVKWIINLLWNAGDGPFTVSYSPDPSFQNGVKTLEKGTSATSRSVTADPGKALEVFDVAGQTALSSAAQGMGYDPEPFPTVSAISGGNLWWGDPVTLTGTYMDPIPKSNTAFMMDLPVRATGTNATPGVAYATSATFTIPDDARGFWSLVQSHGRSSDYGSSSYVPLYAKGIGPFTAIYGINYVPSNGRFWLAADSTVRQLDLFEHTPATGTTLSGFVKPYISRVTSEATPRFLYVDGTLGVTKVYAVNAADGTTAEYASTHDTAFTRNIRPVGIAVDPDGSACYIADASGNKVVKIPAGAGSGSTIVDTWGGRTFTFPDPCGIDVNLGHQIAVAHTNGYIYYIYGQSSNTLYGYAGGLVHSLHFDKDYANVSDTFLFWTNELAMAEAFNRNAIGATPARFHGGVVFGLSNGYIDLEPDWAFYVYRHFPQRVVLNNSGQSQTYPTNYQSADRIIQMQCTGWAGRKVRLRVIDPPDLAPYAPDGGCLQGGCTQVLPYEGNDNKGTTDWGAGLQPDGSDAQVSNTYTIGGDGTLTFYLKVPARYSGDNFQVEVTKCDYAGTTVLPERVAALSSVYTSWKRVFVEKDHMFRRGGLLHDNAAQGDSFILLYKNPNDTDRLDNLVEGDKIAIFDTGGLSGGTFEGAHDEAYIATGGINPNYGSPPPGAPHQVRVDLVTTRGGSTAYTLNHSYTASPANATTFWPDFGNAGGKSAGVGIVNSNDGLVYDTAPNQTNGTGSAFYDADMRNIEQPYDDASLEFMGQRSGSGAIPYLPEPWFRSSSDTGKRQFHQLWFLNKLPMADPQYNNAHNYFHLLSTGLYRDASDVVQNGFTFVQSDASYVCGGSIEVQCALRTPQCNGQQIANHYEETTEHELAHQFGVNGCDTKNHDLNNAWCGSSGGPCTNSNYSLEYCIMHEFNATLSLEMRIDGIARMDCDDLAASGPGCGIPSCAGGISVRTDTDPE